MKGKTLALSGSGNFPPVAVGHRSSSCPGRKDPSRKPAMEFPANRLSTLFMGTLPNPYTVEAGEVALSAKKAAQASGLFVSYCRVSTDAQGASGLGLEAQQAAVAAYVVSRNGMLIEPPFVEVESGAKTDRRELAKALETCRQRKAVLVIAKLDRLGRDVAFIAGLMKAGIEFIAADMPAATPFMLHVYAAVAEEERRMIAARTRAAMQAAKARGVDLGKGARVQQDRALGSAASLAPIIAELRKSGATTVRNLCAALNERGVPSREGRRWHLRSTGLLLQRLTGTAT
jgi:DNA invertase Pin-like site-specific DNA recombinase